MEVTEMTLEVKLRDIQKGELFKLKQDGAIWIKGVCYPGFLDGQKFKTGNKFPCISIENGSFAWLMSGAEVIRAKQSQCMVEF